MDRAEPISYEDLIIDNIPEILQLYSWLEDRRDTITLTMEIPCPK